MKQIRWITYAAAALALATAPTACTRTDEGLPTAPEFEHSTGRTGPGFAIVDYTFLDLDDPEILDQAAQAEILVNESTYLWSPHRLQGAVAALKSRNPDIKVLGYVSAHATWLRWGASEEVAVANPYGWDWYHATKPYWSYTTTGDTMMSWPGKVLLDILNPDCRSAMLDVLEDHFYAHSNVLDGVFWDHFSQLLWVPAHIPGREGEMDLDRDGVPHREDEDEIQAYHDASSALVREFRARFGESIIQVTNGSRAARDSNFAALVDGMFYENFPDVGYSGASMRQALDPGTFNNLMAARNWPRTRNGGPYLILSHQDRFSFLGDGGEMQSYRYAEFARVAALLTDNLFTYHSEDQVIDFGVPDVELNLGQPLGPATFAGDEIYRDFENGFVEISMTAGDLPMPFSFTITQDRNVVQMFEFPSVYP